MDKRSGRRSRLTLLAVAGLAVAGMTAGASSLALFTSSASVPANTFTAGTVVISTSPATALVTFAGMAPGDQVTAPLTVTNAGTLALRYAVSSVATNADTKAVMSQLVLTIKTGVTTCTTAGFAATGTQAYSGVLGALTTTKLIGDAASGAQAGDRALPPTTSNTEVLCFNVSLPLATGDTFQGATTTATFTFDAEQTANN
jgi:spore coat-associated protein N